MPYIRVNRVSLYYEADGQGAPVVFVHGGFPSLASALTDFSTWTWIWEKDFADVFHFLWYERRGCYRSLTPASGYDLENQALDLAKLLDRLHITSAHVVGSSAGGPISLIFAAQYPHRVRSLTLAGTGLAFFLPADPVGDLIRRLVTVLDTEGAEAAFMQRPTGVEASFEPLWVVGEMQARGRNMEYQQREERLARQVQTIPKVWRVHHFAVELRAMQAYMRDDLPIYARQVTCPTLVLHGSDDREGPLAWGVAVAEAILPARLQIIQGEGHSLIQCSVEGRHAVISFIQGIQERV